MIAKKTKARGIDTDLYNYWTLYINTGNLMSSEDYRTKADAERRSKEFEGMGYKLEVIKNTNYAMPDFNNEDSYTHRIKRIIEGIQTDSIDMRGAGSIERGV